MGDSNIPAIFGSLVGDILGAFLGVPGAGTAGTVAGIAKARLFRRRLENARDILIKEIRDGRRLPDEEHQQDELAAIIYRYFEAARHGAARLNLRLTGR